MELNFKLIEKKFFLEEEISGQKSIQASVERAAIIDKETILLKKNLLHCNEKI